MEKVQSVEKEMKFASFGKTRLSEKKKKFDKDKAEDVKDEN